MFLANIEFSTMVQMLYSKKPKAQIIMSDFLIGLVIFLVVIALATSVWGKNIYNMGLKEKRSEMETLVLLISDQLVKSSGIPEDWNSTNIAAIGLAESDNVLSPAKVSNFINLENEKTKNLLGIRNYNFIFRLRNMSENILVEYGNIPVNEKESVIIRRIVLYQGRPAIMDFGLWT